MRNKITVITLATALALSATATTAYADWQRDARCYLQQVFTFGNVVCEDSEL